MLFAGNLIAALRCVPARRSGRILAIGTATMQTAGLVIGVKIATLVSGFAAALRKRSMTP
jgi:hypothetical protein